MIILKQWIWSNCQNYRHFNCFLIVSMVSHLISQKYQHYVLICSDPTFNQKFAHLVERKWREHKLKIYLLGLQNIRTMGMGMPLYQIHKQKNNRPCPQYSGFPSDIKERNVLNYIFENMYSLHIHQRNDTWSTTWDHIIRKTKQNHAKRKPIYLFLTEKTVVSLFWHGINMLVFYWFSYGP